MAITVIPLWRKPEMENANSTTRALLAEGFVFQKKQRNRIAMLFEKPIGAERRHASGAEK
jgi:hypothetical protein